MSPFAWFLSVFFIVLHKPFSSFPFNYAVAGYETRDIHTRTLQTKSLLAPVFCNQSSKAVKKGASLEVVHQYGPCIENLGPRRATMKVPPPPEMLQRDQSRVEWIQARARKSKPNNSSKDLLKGRKADIPVQPGNSLGTGNYVVKVGLGTPKEDLTLVIDTGSDVTWTQCQPCVGSCYQQKETLFDPTRSTTYKNVSCASPSCSLIHDSGGLRGCSSSTCLYQVTYGDGTYSVGFFASEKLTITKSDVFTNYLFGCGQNNKGSLGQAAGLIGLGREQLSLASQTSKKYRKLFSYCLPSASGNSGHFSLGGRVSSQTKFTPFSKDFQDSLFYGLDITGISVGGEELAIAASVFKNAGGIIDSGTVITRLPASAYSKLSSAFQDKMEDYNRTDGISILDTCYDFSNLDEVTLPMITFMFAGGVKIDVDVSGVMVAVGSLKQVCLAIAGNSDDSDIAIFGNTQQKTYEVVYDGAKSRLGFAAGGCD